MKALFIQLKRLGDLLMVTPAVRAFKTAFPGAELHFLVERGSAPAIRHHPLVDRVLLWDELSFVDRLRLGAKTKYDVAVDFMGTPRSARIAWLSRARQRIGFQKAGRSFFYTDAVSPAKTPVYSAEEKLRLLGPLGINAPAGTPEFFESVEERAEAGRASLAAGLKNNDRPVAFSPVSRREYKRWPVEKYAAACDLLNEKHGLRFLPLFGPGEEPFVEAVIAKAQRKEAFFYPYPPPSFGALKGLIERCAFYFGNDNGIRHIAIACGKPTAAVFGIPNPAHWTPPESARHPTLWGRENIENLSVGEVVSLVEKLMAAL